MSEQLRIIASPSSLQFERERLETLTRIVAVALEYSNVKVDDYSQLSNRFFKRNPLIRDKIRDIAEAKQRIAYMESALKVSDSQTVQQ